MSLCLLPSLGFQHLLSLFFSPSSSLCPPLPVSFPLLPVSFPLCLCSLPLPPISSSLSLSPPPPPPPALQQKHIKRRQSGWDCQDDFSEWKFLSSRTENAYKCAAGILQTFCLKQKLLVMEFLRGFQCVCVYVLMLMLVCSLLPLVTACTCRSPVNLLNAVFFFFSISFFLCPNPSLHYRRQNSHCSTRRCSKQNDTVRWILLLCLWPPVWAAWVFFPAPVDCGMGRIKCSGRVLWGWQLGPQQSVGAACWCAGKTGSGFYLTWKGLQLQRLQLLGPLMFICG